MKKQSLISILKDNISCDSISRAKDGSIVFRTGFFYTHGVNAEKFRDNIVKQLQSSTVQSVLGTANIPPFTILDYDEIWKPFRGGASTAQGSHWYVKIAFLEA